MALKKNPKSKKHLLDVFAESRINIFLQSGFYTIVMLGILGGGGYLLDQYFGTKPILFIIGLVIAYPVTQVFLFKKFRGYAKDKIKNTKKNG